MVGGKKLRRCGEREEKDGRERRREGEGGKLGKGRRRKGEGSW